MESWNGVMEWSLGVDFGVDFGVEGSQICSNCCLSWIGLGSA